MRIFMTIGKIFKEEQIIAKQIKVIVKIDKIR